MAFSLEEKVDLLLKKVAFGKTKTDTSENTDGFGESIASPLLLRGDKVMKQSASIPSTPGAVADIVQAYQGADVVQCTAATGTTDTNITGFKRAWSTGHTNWIPSEFSAAYTVEVYVGPSGWNGTHATATTIGGTNGTSTGSDVFRVVPGVETANWFFDYQAGVLYWTNENESGDVGGSTQLTSSIHQDDVVYIKGYKYIGDFGVGGTSDITGAASTIVSANLDVDRALISNASGKVAVSAVTITELGYLDGVTSAIQTQLDGKQASLAFGISDTNIPIFTTGVADDDFLRVDGTSIEGRSASEVLSDIGALSLAGGTMTGNIVFDADQPKGNGGLVPAAGTAGHFLKHDGTFGIPSYTAAPTQGDIHSLAITTVGALSSGSISSNFGAIDIGSSSLGAGAVTVNTLVLGGHNINDIDVTAEFGDSNDHIMSSKAIGARFALINADTTGSAATLTTGRTFKVDLASTAASTAFDGSANITDVGVGGTLPVGNGGTGLTDISTLLNSNVTLSSLGAGTIATQDANAVDIDGGAIDGTTIGANTAAAGTFTTITASSNVTISGDLTVSGAFVQANSTVVDFEDAVLALGVPRDASNAITNGTSTIDTGFNFVKTTSGAAITEFAGLRYDISADKFKFTRHADAGNWTEGQIISGADNVAALKFNMDSADTVSQTNQANNLATMPNDDFANAAAARSLGAISKCQITITNQSNDSGSNFAPDIQGTNGYVIKHNLNTASVYVVAIKDPSGTPTPIFCKYQPIDANAVRVTVGVTTDNEVYDIIVIG